MPDRVAHAWRLQQFEWNGSFATQIVVRLGDRQEFVVSLGYPLVVDDTGFAASNLVDVLSNVLLFYCLKVVGAQIGSQFVTHSLPVDTAALEVPTFMGDEIKHRSFADSINVPVEIRTGALRNEDVIATIGHLDGVAFAMLVYDLIPIRTCDNRQIQPFEFIQFRV